MRKIILLLVLAFAVPAFATVSTTTTRVDSTANGVTTIYNFSFPAQRDADVEVYLNSVKQVSGYTLFRFADQIATPGGVVTFTVAPANGVAVRIQRAVTKLQDSVWSPYSAFKAKTLESQLDRMTMQTQEVDRRVADEETIRASKDAAHEAALALGAVGGSATYVTAAGTNTIKTAADWAAHGPVEVNGSFITAAGAPGSTIPRVMSDVLADTAVLKNFTGIHLDGATDDRAALGSAVTALGAANKTLVIHGQLYLSSGATITIPDNLPVQFEGGASGFVGPGAGQVVFRTHDGLFNIRRDFGAKGDGVADDTPPVQAAVTAAMPTGVEVFGPPGTYKITSAVNIGSASTTKLVRLRGSGLATHFIGNFAGFIFDRNDSLMRTDEGPHYIRDMWVTNSNAGGSAIRFVGAVSAKLSGLRIEAKTYGLYLAGNTFSIGVEDCRLLGYYGIGVMTGGHATLKNIDVVGWTEGIRAYGAGLAIIGGRYEANATGMMLGKDATGATQALGRMSFSGGSFEANDIAIYVNNVAYGTITGVAIQGSTNAPSGQSVNGIYVNASTGLTFIGVGASGTFSDAAAYVHFGVGQNNQLSFISSTMANTFGGASLAWKVWDAGTAVTFINCGTDAAVTSADFKLSADNGDVSLVMNAASARIQRFDTTLTADRTVTLPAAGGITIKNGTTYRIVRTGLGAFTLNVGGLKTIPAGTAGWVDVTYDGAAWRLTGYGTL